MQFTCSLDARFRRYEVEFQLYRKDLVSNSEKLLDTYTGDDLIYTIPSFETENNGYYYCKTVRQNEHYSEIPAADNPQLVRATLS